MQSYWEDEYDVISHFLIQTTFLVILKKNANVVITLWL